MLLIGWGSKPSQDDFWSNSFIYLGLWILDNGVASQAWIKHYRYYEIIFFLTTMLVFLQFHSHGLARDDFLAMSFCEEFLTKKELTTQEVFIPILQLHKYHHDIQQNIRGNRSFQIVKIFVVSLNGWNNVLKSSIIVHFYLSRLYLNLHFVPKFYKAKFSNMTPISYANTNMWNMKFPNEMVKLIRGEGVNYYLFDIYVFFNLLIIHSKFSHHSYAWYFFYTGQGIQTPCANPRRKQSYQSHSSLG